MMSGVLVIGLVLGGAACGGDDDDDDDTEVEDVDESGDVEESDEPEETDEPASGDAAVAASACNEFSTTTINAENAEQFREIANQDGMPADLSDLLNQLVDAGEANDQEAAAALFPDVDALCTQYMAEAGG